MSGDGSTLIKWPDEERRFRLGIGELRELQSKCDAGPIQIFNRVSNGSWLVDDLRETIRLGLIGGGESAQKALALIGSYAGPGKLVELVPIAQTILYAALIGDPNDPVNAPGKAIAETTTDGSRSRSSMEAVPSSDGLPDKSMNSHSLNSPPP